MMETTAHEALSNANERIDAVFVDANGEEAYLPDVLNGAGATDEGEDNTPVLAETDGDGVVTLTVMRDGYRQGVYGRIVPIARGEGA